MIRIFYSQKIECLINKIEFALDAKLLGDDVSITIQNGDIHELKLSTTLRE